MYYIGAGIIVLNAAFLKSKNALLFRGLAYIGKHSYSIYLWHMFFQVALLGIIERRLGLAFNDMQKMICYIIGAIACGICMSEMIDSPVLRLRDKLFPSNV